jgi:hypothetical protein
MKRLVLNMELTKVMGRTTKILTVDTWQGRMVEIRQHDAITQENQVLLSKELILRLAELFKEEEA